MASSKTKDNERGERPRSVLSQEDEADITEEVGAERDEETGGLVASVDKVREIGALDAESVRANRHIRRVADKKRKGEKVSFGIEDPVVHYDAIMRVWENDKVEIRVKNLATRALHLIKSEPRSGVDLYEQLRVLHGQQDRVEYGIEFVAATGKEYIGHSRIVMPDARVPSQQGQPPPQPYYQQQGYPQPAVPPPPAPPQAAPQAPTFVMPAPAPSADPMQTVQQILDIADQLRGRMTPPQPPQPPQPQPQAPIPPPPTSSDPTALLNWALQAARTLQPQTAQPQPQPQQQPAGPTGMPQFAPPPGTAWMYYVPPGASTGGWVAQPLGGNVGVGGAPPQQQRSPFQRPQYFQQGDPNDPQQRGYPPYARPAPERTAAQTFRAQIASARELYDTAQELGKMFNGGSREEAGHEISENDDSPVEIVDVGDKFKYARNREDGAIRWAETGVMVLPGFLKWLGEQHEKIQTAKQEQRRPQTQQRRQVLPPGFVRVDENYEPPKGFVAVPVAEDELPEPPSHVPPTIDEQQEEPRPTWGAPEIPQNG